MDYTPNFHLPQWEKDDRVMMEDFNQMASDLEAALLQNRQAAQSAQEGVQEAQTAARQGDAALAQKDAELAAKDEELARLIAAAQQAADAAQTTADAAKFLVRGCPGIYLGGYRGMGGVQNVDIKVRPWLVFIAGEPSGGLNRPVGATQKYSGILVNGISTPYGQTNDSGFSIIDQTTADCPNLNSPDYIYCYAALALQ